MDKLISMQVFVAVAEAGSFSAAAERLHISRAMASKHVMELEGHLGLRLFNRTTRKVALTQGGAAYAERCRELLATLEETEREVTSQAIEPVGRLRISAPVSFGADRLAPRLDAYVRRYPRVSIDLVLNDRFVDLVEEGYDVAVRIGRLTDSSLVARRIGSTRVLACASPAYLDERGRPQAPADLASHECLHYAYASGGNIWTFEGPGGPETVRAEGRITANNGGATCQMGIKGLGIMRAPDFVVAPYLASGELEEVLSAYSIPLGIYAVHQSHRHVPLKLRTFIDFLGTVCGRHAAKDVSA